MANEYTPAPEVARIARELIIDHHTHLAYQRIEYVFIDPPATSRGKIVWGRAKKVTGLNAWLATPEEAREENEEPQPFFVLEIAKSIWKKLNEKARRALVDHELCHFELDDKDKPTLKPHDLEEFTEIVRRHGLWRPEVEFFIEAGLQGQLFDLEQKTNGVIREMDRVAEERSSDFSEQVIEKVTEQINRGALGPNVTAMHPKRSNAR